MAELCGHFSNLFLHVSAHLVDPLVEQLLAVVVKEYSESVLDDTDEVVLWKAVEESVEDFERVVVDESQRLEDVAEGQLKNLESAWSQ